MLASFAAAAGPACCREDLPSAGWGNQLVIQQHPLGGYWGGSNSFLRYQMWKRRVSTNGKSTYSPLHGLVVPGDLCRHTAILFLLFQPLEWSKWVLCLGFFFNLFFIINFCLFHKSGKEQKKEEVKCLL